MIRTLAVYIATALLALVTFGGTAQPVPVEGTEMVPNEYGSTFPREIIWQADGSRMVLVPFGTFRRGIPAGQGTPAESPETEIYLPSFYIDKFELSNALYREFVFKESGPPPINYGNPENLAPERPVIGITWEAADRYARWTGRQLPTEAMWEKAARGPQNTLFVTGNTEPANTVVISGRGSNGQTVAVDLDTGDVSGYGAFHMNGNASEFVSDWFSRDYYRTSTERENPQGPAETESKTYRGGSYFTRPGELRLTMRRSVSPILIRDEVGFRTAWVPRPIQTIETPVPTPTPLPVPTREEVIQKLVDSITPFLLSGAPQLPREMMAQLPPNRRRQRVQFVNFTPFRMSLSFVGPELETVYVYGEPISEMSYRNMELPTEVDLAIVAHAPDAPRNQPIRIGMVRAESRAIVVLRTPLFAPVVDMRGNRTEIAERPNADYFYQDFTPLWNQVELYNTLDIPILVDVSDLTAGTQSIVPVGQFTIEPKEALMLALNQGRYRFEASYFGAADKCGPPIDLRVNDGAARRLLLIGQDTRNEERVRVVTQRLPLIKMDVREARSIRR